MLNNLLTTILVTLFSINTGAVIGKKLLTGRYSLAHGFLLGTSILSVLFFLLSLIVPVTRSLVLILFAISFLFNLRGYSSIIISTINVFTYPLTFVSSLRKRISHLSLAQAILWIILGLTLLLTIYGNLFWPVVGWDAMTLYDFRGQVFFSEGRFIANHLALGPSTYYYSYPPLTSIIHGLYYFFGADNPSVFYTMLLFSFFSVFYQNISKKLSPFWAIILTSAATLPISIFSHVYSSYTNLPYLIYYCLSLIVFTNYLDKKRPALVLVSALYLASSLFVRKDEPFWISSVIMAAVVIFKTKSPLPLKYIFSSVFLIMAARYGFLKFAEYRYANFLSHYPIAIGLDAPNISQILSDFQLRQIPQVAIFLSTYLKFPPLILFALITTLVILFISKTINHSLAFLVLVFIGNLGLLYLGTLYFSTIYVWWTGLGDSVSRMVIFFHPLIVYFIALSLHDRR